MPDDSFKEFVLDQLGALPEFANRAFGNALKRQVWLAPKPAPGSENKKPPERLPVTAVCFPSDYQCLLSAFQLSASRRESAGCRRESAGSRVESMASRRESAGCRRESAGSRVESMASRRESAGSLTNFNEWMRIYWGFAIKCIWRPASGVWRPASGPKLPELIRQSGNETGQALK